MPIPFFCQVWLATLFALLTAVTTLNANGVPLLQFLVDPFHTEISTQVRFRGGVDRCHLLTASVCRT